MTAEQSYGPAVPAAVAGDPDDVVWALETSAVEWGRGAYSDAILWIRRAADAAIEREAWTRASELNAVATQLSRMLEDAGRVPAPRAGGGLDDIDELLASPMQPRVAGAGAPRLRPPAPSTTVEFAEIDVEEIDAELVESGIEYAIDDEGDPIEVEEIEDPEVLDPEIDVPWDDLTLRVEDIVSDTGGSRPSQAELWDADRDSGVEDTPLKSPSLPVVQKLMLRATTDYLDLETPAADSVQASGTLAALAVDPAPVGGVSEDPEVGTSDLSAADLLRFEPARDLESLADSAEAPPEPVLEQPISASLARALRTHDLAAQRGSSRPPGSKAPSSRRRPPSSAPASATRPSTRSSPNAAGSQPQQSPSERPPDPVILGVSLQGVEGLEDLPVAAQQKLVECVRLEQLSADETVGDFAVALVLRGEALVMPVGANVTAAEVKQAEVVFTRGSLDEPFALRVVAGKHGVMLGLWDVAALDDVTRDCPWVADELRMVADRHQALAGLCLGEIGTRLDLGLRKMAFEQFKVRYVMPGEVLCEKGERLTGMYVVGVGGVEILVGGREDARVSRVLGSGEVLFARQVLGAGSAPASARGAPSGALVLFAPRAVAHELMVSVPPLLEILAG